MEPKTKKKKMSLSSKLETMCRALEAEGVVALDSEQVERIARHMPRSESDLSKLIPDGCVSAYGARILDITIHHERDQERFEDCIQELKAFLRGGMAGVARLRKVYTQILKGFAMENEKDEVLAACDLYVHAEDKKLRRKIPEISEEGEDFEWPHAIQ